jgi:hypothetical protein
LNKKGALGCLKIIVDLVVSVFFGFSAYFSLFIFLFDGCFYLGYRVLGWFLPFSRFFFDG